MNDFPIAFCKTPFVNEIYQWISLENSTTGKEDSKTKFYFEKVPIMSLHSAIFKCALSQISSYSFTFNEINSTPANIHSPLKGI